MSNSSNRSATKRQALVDALKTLRQGPEGVWDERRILDSPPLLEIGEQLANQRSDGIDVIRVIQGAIVEEINSLGEDRYKRRVMLNAFAVHNSGEFNGIVERREELSDDLAGVKGFSTRSLGRMEDRLCITLAIRLLQKPNAEKPIGSDAQSVTDTQWQLMEDLAWLESLITEPNIDRPEEPLVRHDNPAEALLGLGTALAHIDSALVEGHGRWLFLDVDQGEDADEALGWLLVRSGLQHHQLLNLKAIAWSNDDTPSDASAEEIFAATLEGRHLLDQWQSQYQGCQCNEIDLESDLMTSVALGTPQRWPGAEKAFCLLQSITTPLSQLAAAIGPR